MMSLHTTCGYCKDDKAENFENAKYKVNGSQYEGIKTSVFRPPG